jgi:UDP-N-acetylmuramate dehydrogenase
VHFDVPMSRYTSLCVGGPADALARPGSRRELARVLAICAAHRIPHQLVGAGFNTLVLDGGIDGVALQLGRLRALGERPGQAVRAEAGVSHSQVTRFCVQRGLGGLEFTAGIPGTVGGWVAMNAGIPGREAKDAVREVEVMSPTGRSRRHLDRRALRFGYRALRGLAPGSVIVSALFGVTPSTPEEVRAGVERLLSRRAETQPLNVPSCGSVFKNPPGDFAGRLIEEAGLKGFRIGQAQISPVHANFIANLGGASASDVLALIETARKAVEARSGVRLVPEVRVLGRRT